MKEKIAILLILIFLIIAFLNSYDVRGVEELSYVIAIGLDKSDSDDNNIVITIQIASTSSDESGGTSNLNVELLSVETSSIGLGFSMLNTLSTNELNLSHCSGIIISEELATQGINPYFDNLANNIEIRPTANIIISNCKAQEFLEATSNSEDISAKYYNSFIQSATTTAYISETSLSDFYSALHDDVKNPTAIYGFSDGTSIDNVGLAIFLNDKYVTRLSGIQTILYNIFTNDLDSATISITSPFNSDYLIDVQIALNSDTDITVTYDDEKNIPNITSYISIEAKVLSSAQDYDFSNPNDIAILEEAINNKISSEAYNFFNIMKKYNADIIGFYGYLKRNYLYYDDLENIDWDSIFRNSNFIVNSNVKLTSNYLFPRV